MGYTLQMYEMYECEKTTTTSTHTTPFHCCAAWCKPTTEIVSSLHTDYVYFILSYTLSHIQESYQITFARLECSAAATSVVVMVAKASKNVLHNNIYFASALFTSCHALRVCVCLCMQCVWISRRSLHEAKTKNAGKREYRMNVCMCVWEGIRWVVYCGSFKMFSTVYLMALRNLMYVSKYHESNYYFLSTPIARQSTERNVCLALGSWFLA